MIYLPQNISYTPLNLKTADLRCKTLACPKCGLIHSKHKDTKRSLLDIDLESRSILLVSISTFICDNEDCDCKHYQVEIPFAGKGARYTDRAKDKVIKSVIEDGGTLRATRARVLRDFNILPANASVSRWVNGENISLLMGSKIEELCTTQLSGILCIDEAYDKRLGVIVAVDPVEKGKTVAYLVTDGKIDQKEVGGFITHLKEAGINIDGVVTDRSKLYPAVLNGTLGPGARHQLCLFHLSANIVGDIHQAMRDVVYQKAKTVRERKEVLKEIHVLLKNPSNILKRAGRTLRSSKRWAARHKALLEQVKQVLERYPFLKIYSDFMKAYYWIWEAKTEQETWDRRNQLLNNPEFQKEPALKKPRKRLENDEVFKQYVYNFEDSRIPRTNNAAERACRKIRQQQKKRYRGFLDEKRRRSGPVILCTNGSGVNTA